MIPSHSRRRSSKLSKVNQSSFSQRISLVKGRNSNAMLSFERSKCRFQWSTGCLTGDFDPHYWPFRSKTTSEKLFRKNYSGTSRWLLWAKGLATYVRYIEVSLYRGSFSYISLLLGFKNIFRYIEVSLYPVALLWMITVKDSVSRPFTDLNKAKLYSIRSNQQKHNSVMPAFTWHSVISSLRRDSFSSNSTYHNIKKAATDNWTAQY